MNKLVSQTEMAEILGIGERTFRRIINNDGFGTD